MKRIFAIILCLLLCFSVGCGNATGGETTHPTQQETAPTESPEEENVLKIMILGSSRSVNTFQLLYDVFKDQMPEQELVLGIMYYSGCSMSMHVNFIKQGANVYHYYRNDSGRWDIFKEVNMDMGLQDQKWDIVLLQAGTGDLDYKLNEAGRIFLRDYVAKTVNYPHQLWWHSTWFNSTDPSLYYVGDKKPEDAAKVDPVAQLTATNEAAKQYALTDPMFAGHITSGTPMMYAIRQLNVPETELFKDHTHTTDYGSLLVGYSFYAQFTGNPVTQIGLETIPAYTRGSAFISQGDFTVTQEMKDVILKTVAYTLENPWSVPSN